MIDVTVLDDAPISCGALVSRHRGRLTVTAIVKATFSLVPNAVCTLARPSALVARDKYVGGNPAASLEAASDLVPFRPRVDVTFVGDAHGVALDRDGASTARLAVFRGRPLVDKAIHVRRADGRAGEPVPIVYERALRQWGPEGANPVGSERPDLLDPRDVRRPIGFGPLRPEWPVRASKRGKARIALGAAIVDIPDDVDWSFFQAAPADQQLEALHGDEWLLLEGLHAVHPRIRTRLMPTSALARLHGAGAPQPPIALVPDTLAIDGRRGTFDVVWRGSAPVLGGESALAALRITAALEVPGRRINWSAAPAPRGAPANGARSQRAQRTVALPVAMPAPDALRGTRTLSDAEEQRARHSPTLPFEAGKVALLMAESQPQPARPRDPLDATVETPNAVLPMVEPFPLARPRLDLPGVSNLVVAPASNDRAVDGLVRGVPGSGSQRRIATSLSVTMPPMSTSPMKAPFPVAVPGPPVARAAAAPIPGAPWAAAAVQSPPPIDEASNGTLIVELPHDMLSQLASAAQASPPAPPPPAVAAKKRPPALPLKGQLYGKPSPQRR